MSLLQGQWHMPDGEPARSACESAGDLGQGKVNSADLTHVALERAARGEGGRAFTRVYDDWARQLAELSDHTRSIGLVRSPVEGLPVSIKDLFDVKGETTCSGSVVLRDAPPATEHARVVQKLLNAGAVIVGRTNMTEFAYSGLGLNPHHGTPANPWDRPARRIPGGSSSGAAVSVSDGMCSAALGSDTGGSVRVPAAFCGLTGFKPTARRVSRAGVLPLSETLDSIGTIAHDVDSCVLLDAIIAESPLRPAKRDLSRAHFAVPENFVLDGLDEPVSEAFQQALRIIERAGAVLDAITIPEFSQLPALTANGGFNAAESWAWHAELLSHRRQAYDPRVAVRIERGKGFLAIDLLRLVQARQRWIVAVEERLRPYDALLMPTVPIVAPRVADLEADEDLYFRTNALVLRNASLINFLDGCAVSVPCQAPGSAPVGLSVAGPALRDGAIVQWSRAIERVLQV